METQTAVATRTFPLLPQWLAQRQQLQDGTRSVSIPSSLGRQWSFRVERRKLTLLSSRRRCSVDVRAKKSGAGSSKVKSKEPEAEEDDAERAPGTKKLFKLPGTQKLPSKGGNRAKDNNTVFVAGATGKVGRRTVKELVRLGYKVRAGVRNPDNAQFLLEQEKEMDESDNDEGEEQPKKKGLFANFSVEKLFGFLGPKSKRGAGSLELVECDLEKSVDIIEVALGNAGVVICTIGASEKEALDVTGPYRIDYKATKNLIDAASTANVNHFILVTSLGTQKFGWPAAVLNLFWAVLYWKAKAEEALVQSGIPFTIVRPGGMERPTDVYKETHNLRLAEADTLFGGQVSNLQVAELMAAVVGNLDLARNKILEAVAETTAPLLPFEDLLAEISSVDEETEPVKERSDIPKGTRQQPKQQQEEDRAAVLKRQAAEKEKTEALRQKLQQEYDAARFKEEEAKLEAEAAEVQKAEIQRRTADMRSKLQAAEQAAREAKALETALIAAARQGKKLSDREKQDIIASVRAESEAEQKTAEAKQKAVQTPMEKPKMEAKAKTPMKSKAEVASEKQAKQEAEKKVKQEAEAKAAAAAELAAKAEAEAKAKADAAEAEKKRMEAEQKAQAEEEKKKIEAEVKAKEEEDKKRIEAEVKAKEEEDKKRIEAEVKAKEEEDKKRIEAEVKAKEEEDKKRIEAEVKAKEEEMKKKIEAESKAKEEKEIKKKIEAERKAKEEEEEQKKKIEAQRKTQEEDEEQAAKIEARTNPKGFRWPWQKQELEEEAGGSSTIEETAVTEELPRTSRPLSPYTQFPTLKPPGPPSPPPAKVQQDVAKAEEGKSSDPVEASSEKETKAASGGFRWPWQTPETEPEEETPQEAIAPINQTTIQEEPTTKKTEESPSPSEALSPYTAYPALKPPVPPTPPTTTVKLGGSETDAKVEAPKELSSPLVEVQTKKCLEESQEEIYARAEKEARLKARAQKEAELVMERERIALEKAQAAVGFPWPWGKAATDSEGLQPEVTAASTVEVVPEPTAVVPEVENSAPTESSQSTSTTKPQKSRPLSPYIMYPGMKPPGPPSPPKGPTKEPAEATLASENGLATETVLKEEEKVLEPAGGFRWPWEQQQ